MGFNDGESGIGVVSRADVGIAMAAIRQVEGVDLDELARASAMCLYEIYVAALPEFDEKQLAGAIQDLTEVSSAYVLTSRQPIIDLEFEDEQALIDQHSLHLSA